MNRHSARASLGMLVLLCSASVFSLPMPSQSVPSQPTNNLSLKQALQLTLQYNPQLKTYPYYVRQLEGEYKQADISPAPRAELELSSDEATLTLSQSFELGEKRKARVGFTHAKQQQLQTEFEIAKLDILAETSRRYYQLLALVQQKNLLTIRIGQENRALKIIKQRAEAGAVAEADVATMALGLARSNNTLEQLEFSIQLQKTTLSTMWLEQEKKEFKNLKGNLSILPQLPSDEVLTQIIEEGINQLPDFRYQVALSRFCLLYTSPSPRDS